MTAQLFEKHKETLQKAINAIHSRQFYAHFPEHPKAYGEEAANAGKPTFEAHLGKKFEALTQSANAYTTFAGEEQSPYTLENLNIQYPINAPETLIANAQNAAAAWGNATPQTRAAILVQSLEQIATRFHEIAYATMHTTGQSFIMSFQASGPHAADRALEAVALGYHELTRFPQQLTWEKPMGKATLKLEKQYNAIPKGIALVIGCSTFPTWNTVPGLYASLITGNPVIVKPHPKAILPIAIFIDEIQKVLTQNGFSADVVQLAPDTTNNLITKHLAEHPQVAIIDYTGGSAFGAYVEQLPNKTTFTEKAGINSVIIESVHDLREVMRNLAFSVSLYSGQMCTAPQNFFIPETGIPAADGEVISYADAVALLKNEIASLALHPQMGAGTLGAIQSNITLQRAQNAPQNVKGTVVLSPPKVQNAEFANARTCATTIIETTENDFDVFSQELFGPIILVVKTQNAQKSLELATQLAQTHGAITCSLYTTNAGFQQTAIQALNRVFTPVSVNFLGAAFVNQHATFSDFHVTGGNPAGNASFTNPEYISKRFVWVGNRINA